MNTRVKSGRRKQKEMSVLTMKDRLEPALEQELLSKQHALREDYLWIDSKIKTLSRKYRGKYVVVQNKEVIASGKSPLRLLAKVCKSGQKMEDFAIQYIGNCPACLLV